MEPWRLLLLVFGPLPIVVASLAVSRWARPTTVDARESNRATIHAAHDRGQPAPSLDLDQRCQTTAEILHDQVPADWSLVVRPPFVLSGNLRSEELDRWHRQTIAPAAAAFAGSFQARAADEPLTVLLFSDEATYAAAARRLFGDEQLSIYGYYRPHGRVLVINIGTGAGTLIHELTHALLEFDFPKVPDWFNEGLASLHEECRVHPAASPGLASSRGPVGIEGLENWRLPILQAAIAENRLPPLAEFLSSDFRRGETGLNYALARYLCLYLQRQGRLVEFYDRFRAEVARDPQGLATLREVLDGAAWAQIEREFATWAVALEWSPAGSFGQ